MVSHPPLLQLLADKVDDPLPQLLVVNLSLPLPSPVLVASRNPLVKVVRAEARVMAKVEVKEKEVVRVEVMEVAIEKSRAAVGARVAMAKDKAVVKARVERARAEVSSRAQILATSSLKVVAPRATLIRRARSKRRTLWMSTKTMTRTHKAHWDVSELSLADGNPLLWFTRFLRIDLKRGSASCTSSGGAAV